VPVRTGMLRAATSSGLLASAAFLSILSHCIACNNLKTKQPKCHGIFLLCLLHRDDMLLGSILVV
jgi:hypothetical protein